MRFGGRGLVIDLGRFPDGSFSLASGVNNRGQIAGHGDTMGADTAFLWQRGVMTALMPVPGGRESAANAINNRGPIVGAPECCGFSARRGLGA